MDNFTQCFNKHEPVDTVYFDFSKAFETVPHGRLLIKQGSYGIVGNLHSQIESFLKDRKQWVIINGVYSNFTSVTSGIPKGSIFASILFLIFY